MNVVTVDAKALRDVLQALVGAPHEIRELKAIDNLPTEEGSIAKLVRQFNEAIEAHKRGEVYAPKTK